jgi:hypothetical protein
VASAPKSGGAEIETGAIGYAGDRDDRNFGRVAPQFANDLEAFFLRHNDVGDNESRSVGQKEPDPIDAIGRLAHVVPRCGERPRHSAAKAGVVFDQQNFRHVSSSRVLLGDDRRGFAGRDGCGTSLV